VRKNQLSAQTQFLDFVSPLELQCLYKLCRCVVIPTKFEAASFPIWDAFLAGTPVACSNVTSLPQQVGKEALLFDPEDTGAIADAIQKLWTDPLLCKKLVAGGRANVTRFTWSRTVRHFRAHYRRIAGRLLTDEDWQILQAPPLL
jgi:alpha-1,3-rhamnosyl/mannosyltransferase